ncbi:cadherin-like domain-containing protein [Vibrio furnissii]|uniref:Ig-like domain-containing protein n=1 Tax=Vibrio furnissii TaxID=29494 RepID=UPI0024B9128A|nr:cadherin-like domain-containing protein [Vibrio furnissii]WHR54019.1 cadherin-like domain-containing protein [Vibrio furnissii]
MNQFSLGLFASIGVLMSVNTAYAAQTTALEGTLSIEYEDFQGHSQLKYWLIDNQNNRSEIALARNPGWLKSGQHVRLHGQANNDKFAVDDEGITLLSTGSSSSTTTTVTSTNATAISGERTILVVEVHAPSYDVDRYTTSEISELVLNQANQFFQETSYGAMSLTGQVAPSIVVDYDTTSCKTPDLAMKAQAVLASSGYDVNAYDHVMYLMPYYGACSWSGKAEVSGKNTFIRRFAADTVFHELGHNLGLYHANKKECGTAVTDGSNCTVTEYGDTLSAMGNATYTTHFNSFHKEQLGWLDNRVVTLQSSGLVTLSVFEESDNSAPKTLKVLKGINASGNAEWYYIEYRQAVGFDGAFGTYYAHYLDGVRLREGTDNTPSSSLLLDTTPESATDEGSDWYDISLHPGQTYQDAHNGISISVVSSDAASVTLEVLYGNESAATCTVESATLTASSTAIVNAQAGDAVQFTYSVTNNDTSECGSATFTFSDTLPTGWSADLSQTQLTLQPGETQQVSMSVMVPSDADAADYWVQANAQRSGSSATSSATNQVRVTSSDTGTANQAPQAMGETVIINSITAVTIDVLSNDYDADGDNLQLVSVGQGSKGTVYANGDGTLTYVPAKSFKSTDSFTYTITDGTDTATATVNIELQKSSTGSGSETTSGSKGGKGKTR